MSTIKFSVKDEKIEEFNNLFIGDDLLGLQEFLTKEVEGDRKIEGSEITALEKHSFVEKKMKEMYLKVVRDNFEKTLEAQKQEQLNTLLKE